MIKCNVFISKRFKSIDYLLSSVSNKSTPNSSVWNDLKYEGEVKLDKQAKSLVNLQNQIISPPQLNASFLGDGYLNYSEKQKLHAANFFVKAKVDLDWTLADYEEIPDIKYERLAKERKQMVTKTDAYTNRQHIERLANSKKTFGIKPELLQLLPEVLIMGHTNVGKSSLINALLMNQASSQRNKQLAYVSKKAGYTKTLNAFRISNKFKFIDSPGYGTKADPVQGKLVVDYVNYRNLLKKVFLLIDSNEGFRESDEVIVNHLIDQGVPFDIIFTKVDQVVLKLFHKNLFKEPNAEPLIEKGNENLLNYFENMVHDSGLDSIAMLPRFMFSNIGVNKFIRKPLGLKEIRCNILESCGL